VSLFGQGRGLRRAGGRANYYRSDGTRMFNVEVVRRARDQKNNMLLAQPVVCWTCDKVFTGFDSPSPGTAAW